MIHSKTFMCSGLGLLLVAATAAAEPGQGSHRRIDTGMFLGGNYFSSQVELGNSYFADQVPESAFLLGARGTYVLMPELAPGSALAPGLAVEIEAKLALSSTAGMAENMREAFFAPVLGWRAHARLNLWSTRAFRPFAVLGVGGETVFSDSPFMAGTDTDAEVHWGLGGEYALSPRYGLRGDFRHGITAGRSNLAASTVEFHVGFYYSFDMGAARKEPEPEPVVVTEPIVPAAEPAKPADTDSDGIPDNMDQCPNRAEVYNEIDDQDGCPEEDSDDDGLLGERDQCPAAAEDMDGFEDEDGCPDLDNDKDGRPDVIDGCPLEAETLNGFEDDDGCPDEIPPQVVQYTGVIKGIQFRSGNARILRKSHTTLNKAAAILKQYPSVRLRISGHTDNRGKAERNLRLSRQRADAVKWYLVDKGIDESRFETVGYGPDKPVADNKTRKGRAENRRIEFELLPGPAEIPDPRNPQPSDTSSEDSASQDKTPGSAGGDTSTDASKDAGKDASKDAGKTGGTAKPASPGQDSAATPKD